MTTLSRQAIEWIAEREPDSNGEISFAVLPEQRDEIVAAVLAVRNNLPISICIVEDDEGFVRLAADGQLICRVPVNGPKGLALLRLNAALTELRSAKVQSPPSGDKDTCGWCHGSGVGHAPHPRRSIKDRRR